MPNKVEAIEGTVTPLGDEQITGLSSVKTLTVPDGASFALITPTTQGVRWRDSANPTASLGQPIFAGSTLKFTGNLKTVRFIEISASAVLDVAYFGAN